ncbi:gfo/Idh/MocA family oxidoreductase [candidate division KSB3 bacterium]|uniref:Gfo/Idh/MocA family oxidoreductase n=1 Tax=candidate division KSB3 bacterium TaxID=2044937 RepID=A0A9D5Q6B5_9BACT|nr:gfo/Idh/MocA family oxidoreductase [candidate division KSB3 bacterium]MBD3324751.1 gfo/Idh/MocA family oxidoreductase [candidate division KSB3 bacterium]
MAHTINVAVVGLGFGANFVPVFQAHLDADCFAICQRNTQKLDEMGDQLGVARRFTSYEALLEDPALDAVTIMSPVADHAWMTLAALKAGKHVACTVPMATTKEECFEIIEARKASGKVYMMMETAVYTREFLYVKELLETGKLGKIQFLRGSHQQNMGMPGWPAYWHGLPPMHYATHAVGPLLALANAPVESVVCHGSGRIREDYIPCYGSPFSVETALLKLRDSDIVCEVTRSLFDVIRQYRESLDVYGSKLSFEWEQTTGAGHLLYSGYEEAERVDIPDYGHLLPPEIAPLTMQGFYDEEHAHASFLQGGGHGGSYPHLVHEFIRAIIEQRESAIDVETAANWTMVGICAHESAMQDGKRIAVPSPER